MLTQAPTHELLSGSEAQEWSYSPVAFILGEFLNASSRWTTPEKESHAVLALVIRLSHIVVSFHEFSLFPDHKNILYMMSPTLFNANVSLNIVHKVKRWELRLYEFNFTIDHISGEDKVWADILTRWEAPENATFPARLVKALRVPLLTFDMS